MLQISGEKFGQAEADPKGSCRENWSLTEPRLFEIVRISSAEFRIQACLVVTSVLLGDGTLSTIKRPGRSHEGGGFDESMFVFDPDRLLS